MDKKKLNGLLDSIYELEGLVHLAISRDDEPESLSGLVVRKAREMVGLCEAVCGDMPVKAEPPVLSALPETPETPETPEPRGRLVFTLNDRYRFRRELFGNSDADFNTSLALVASMDNYDEAEDFFLNEKELNPEMQSVADFLSIIRKYFGE